MKRTPTDPDCAYCAEGATLDAFGIKICEPPASRLYLFSREYGGVFEMNPKRTFLEPAEYNAGLGDDDGAGLGWTVARGGLLRTWNGLDGVFGVWAGLFPREGNTIPLPPSLPLPYRTAAGRVKEFFHALARADGGGASTGTPPGVPGATRR